MVSLQPWAFVENPKMSTLNDQDQFRDEICHSSNLDGEHIRGKRAVIIGGRASAIEALKFAVRNGVSEIDVLSRSDKWIIPRNTLVQSLLACNIWGVFLGSWGGSFIDSSIAIYKTLPPKVAFLPPHP